LRDDIIVLGGGFAGLAAARELRACRQRHFSVRLVDRRDASVFAPLLPDVISGLVSPRRLRAPLPPLCRRWGIRFTRAQVRGIDPHGPAVATDAGVIRASRLILCLGCETNYFGSREARERAVGLKSLREAQEIRARVLRLAETLRWPPGGPPARGVLIVGGGYTGIETAGHVALLLHEATGLSARAMRRAAAVTVVERSERVLGGAADHVRRLAAALAHSLGITVRTGCTVHRFGHGAVTLTDGVQLGAGLVVWAAGVAPGEACDGMGAAKGLAGRLAVDEHLGLVGFPRVFAAGDVAAARPPGAGAPLRMAVQFSLAGGRCAARNALRSLQGREPLVFQPHDPGYVLPLGPGRAAGAVFGRELAGRSASLLHYLMCCARTWQWRDRLGVACDLLRSRSTRQPAGRRGRS
jgi:NADH dehydrogenase